MLDELIAKLHAIPEADKQEIIAATNGKKWIPNPGPQTDAYFSKADCLLYGGEPGGGKSQLLLGLAFNCHLRTLVMRRHYGDLERLTEDAITINGSRSGYSGSPPPKLTINSIQVINFRAAQYIGDEQRTMGQGRDLLAIDEATHFAESQIRFMMGWVRTETKGQRCRTVLATNPPLSAEGLWVTKMFAPWLDGKYPNPALPGELRWVISDAEGNDEWVDGPEDTREVNGKVLEPTSRSYIPASVKDNPYYAATDYEKNLDAMPEPFRSQLMGGFQTAFEDQEFQIIPTDWVTAAQARWKPDGYKEFAMTAIALDPAGGGKDAMEIVARHGGWFAPFVSVTGKETADGSATAGTVIANRRDSCPVIVDIGGGYGGAPMLRLKDNSIDAVGFDGAASDNGTTIDRGLKFINKRVGALWRLREALDPNQEGGSVVSLPPDQELLADLTAPVFEVSAGGIKAESKKEIRKRLGRSTGKGDCVMMCLSEGNAAVKRSLRRTGNLQTTANRGFSNMKRSRR